MSSLKREINSSDFEVDSREIPFRSTAKTVGLLESTRTALTALCLLAGITILGTSADALAAYQSTHLPTDYLLPLWPADFNIRPTVALVACSAIVVLANGASLALGRAKSLRDQMSLNPAAAVAPPVVALVAAVVAMCFFYAVNGSSTVDTLQSWSCQWRDVAMATRPHFGTLCKQSRAAVSLSVVLVPLEILVIGVAAWELVAMKAAGGSVVGSQRKTASPTSQL